MSMRFPRMKSLKVLLLLGRCAYLGGDQDDGLALSPLLALNDIEHLGVLLLEAAVEELVVQLTNRKTRRKRGCY